MGEGGRQAGRHLGQGTTAFLKVRTEDHLHSPNPGIWCPSLVSHWELEPPSEQQSFGISLDHFLCSCAGATNHKSSNFVRQQPLSQVDRKIGTYWRPAQNEHALDPLSRFVSSCLRLVRLLSETVGYLCSNSHACIFYYHKSNIVRVFLFLIWRQLWSHSY